MASADTTGTISGDGWFSFKYNSADQGNGVSVSLYDGSKRFSVVNQGTYLEVRINGVYQTDFLLDLAKTIKIERVGGSIKVWQDSALRWTSSSGVSTTPADFRISCGGDSSAIGTGINTAMISTAAVPGLVTVSGRVTNAANRGLARILVKATDLSGAVRSSVTNPFGYFSFANLPTGTYTFLFISKSGIVGTTSQSILADTTNLNLIVN